MEEEGCKHLNQNNVTFSLQGKLIYKDQCTKCFHDAKDQQGLNLCLKCFNGSCVSNQNHSLDHFNKTQHAIVLNIKLIEVEKDPESKPEQITKLAIGKPGGAQLGGPDYQVQTSVYCYQCKKEVNCQPIQGVVQSVMQADSVFKKADLCGWEDEAMPCEHTLTLQQQPNVKIEQMSLAHCKSCDLSTNLWLCLTCGALGCGRKQPDGSGGNGHAVQHYNQFKHPLVVKLGTITADGNASLYCYQCDTDVKDQELPQHLINFGIEINKQQKTEKTMAEINLALNLTITLSSIVEEGKQLFPIFGKELTGLDNIGNSCYINSVLQILFSIEEFKTRYYLEGVQHLKQCTNFPPQCFNCQFSKLGHGICSGEYSIKKEHKQIGLEMIPEANKFYQDGIKIYDLRSLIGKGHPEFSSNRMQDSVEYFQHLMQFIQKEEKKNNLKDIFNIFQMKVINKLKCTGCQGVKLREGKTTEIKLPIRPPTKQEIEYELQKQIQIQQYQMKDEQKEVQPRIEDPEYNVSFIDSIKTLQSGEAVEVFCPKCKQNTIFISRLYLKTLPKYIIMPVMRFVLENWVPRKLNALINIPEECDLQDFVYKTEPNEVILEDQQQNQNQQQFPQVSDDLVNQLELMGFSRFRAIRALLACQNDLELATNWIFERIDDNTLDQPMQMPQQAQPQNKQFVSEENIAQVEQMGFTKDQARIALQRTDNDIPRAIEYLFSHDPSELVDEPQQQIGGKAQEEQDEPITSTKYALQAALIHLGKSAQAGHYVSYIKKQEKWILFNDAKVAETKDPILGKGYIYFFKKI